MLQKWIILFLFISVIGLSQAQYNTKGGRKTKQPPRILLQQKEEDTYEDNRRQQQREDDGSSNSVEEGEGAPEPPALVPETSFSCEGKPYDPGMYADQEVGCTVYHMCFMGRKESFLCGTGTIFNQEILSCDYPANVDCDASPNFYNANEELGKPGAEPSGDAQQQKPRPGASRPSQPSRPSPSRPSKDNRSNRPRPVAPPARQPPQQEYDEPAPTGGDEDDGYDAPPPPPSRPAARPQPKAPAPAPRPRPPSKTNRAKPASRPRTPVQSRPRTPPVVQTQEETYLDDEPSQSEYTVQRPRPQRSQVRASSKRWLIMTLPQEN